MTCWEGFSDRVTATADDLLVPGSDVGIGIGRLAPGDPSGWASGWYVFMARRCDRHGEEVRSYAGPFPSPAEAVTAADALAADLLTLRVIEEL